ncbi:MAG: acetyltransferase [Gallionella sp.]|jgi:sugar O-acyltransferase (sialic acid O-acetyltransferase NeuD family)|nr:acetyltransferase [Gallionella sp.]
MNKTKQLVIVGDSAFAEIAHEYFDVDSNYKVVAFSVERDFLKNDEKRGLPIVPFEELETHFDPATHEVYVAATYTQFNRLRARLATTAKAKGYRLASYISSRAFVWRNVELGEHCFIFEDNTVQPFVRIGNNVVLWSGNHIGHHSLIRDNCFIASHAVISGFCDIGENSFIGVNATLANNVTIGKDNWIGPNVAIMKNTEADALYKTDQPEPAKISASRFFKIKE